jgi:hypothetical protein
MSDMNTVFNVLKIIALTGIHKPQKVLTGRSVFLSGFVVCGGSFIGGNHER